MCGCGALCACVLGICTAQAQEPNDREAGDSEPTEELPPVERGPRQPADVEEPEPADAEATGSQVTPPTVIEQVQADYPSVALAERREARVELFVTVLTDGSVGEVDVTTSAGSDFDAAAISAVRRWRFEPARRGEEPIAARIRIPFDFSPPEVELVDDPGAAPSTTGQPDESEREPQAEPIGDAAALTRGTDTPIEVTVRGERELRTEQRSVSDYRIERDVLAAAPRQEGAEILRAAPGLYIGRGEGAAVAHNYVLRGFDAEHGQDIEFRVGGLPINLPSHLHGQGYTDLTFLIADTVRELKVSEGVYDPRQGDFAVAGSIDIQLGVEEGERGVRLRSGYGSFNTFRQLAMWAPRGGPEESFGAVQYMSTDGFGENRSGQLGSAIVQHRFGEGDVTFRTLGIVHASRSDMAGVLRREDVDSGQVCFECVYPFSTARAQNALNSRVITGAFADYQGNEGANGQVGLWLGYDSFRIQQNFTGFLELSRTLARTAGRGDLIEQTNETFSIGLTGRYRTKPFRPTSWARGTIEVGVDARLDAIEQAQNLIDAAVRNQTWDTRIDASVRALDVGLFGDLDWNLTEYVRARVGVRADVLSYTVDDRLGNFVPLTRPTDSFISGFRRSALGVAAGPRASLEVRPTSWFSVLAAYGEGYRSPQARLLEDGEDAPFSKVRSADLGVRFDWGDPLQLTIGGYYTRLSDDVAFEAAEGRLERIGATERLGAVVHAVIRPLDWLVGSASLTLVDATLLEPPPPTAEEPDPPFVEGQNLPFVPPVVIRADLGARKTLVSNLWGHSLIGRAGLGFSYLSPRPLPFGDSAEPFALLDASLGMQWSAFNLTFEVFNALNTEYAAVEYAFPSDWNPDDGVRPRTPARHFSAGSPFAWMVSLGVQL